LIERPSKLFYGVDQQLAIFTASKLDKIENLYITSMKHWATNPSDERQFLFTALKYNCIDKNLRIAEVIPKVDYEKEIILLNKILSVKAINRDEVFYDKSKSKIYYRNAGGRYWKLVKSFPTYFKSDSGKDNTSTEKELTVHGKYLSQLVALYSSSLFYLYWRIVSNCRHLTNREFESFPIPDFFNNESCISKLKELSDKFEASLEENKFRKEIFNSNSGKIIQDEYYVRLSKPIIDEIDRVLAKHYGFTEEELDYIINYDIKYRMGAEDNEE
jgi:hypothetical protein